MDRKSQKIIYIAWLLLTALPLFLLSSCFTGVEGTKRVELTQRDIQQIRTIAEDRIMDSLPSRRPTQWERGRAFVVLDDRVVMIFDSRTLPPQPMSLHLGGKTLHYDRITTGTAADGRQQTQIIFRDSDREYIYIASDTTDNFHLPMMVDRCVVQTVDRRLRGKEIWLRTPLRNTPEGVSVIGRKYIPVIVDSVVSGRGAFPLHIYFTDSVAGSVYVPISFGKSRLENRSFSSQFSLSDPRRNHPGIDDDVWALIQSGKVREGMTKNECRLALGAPSDISSGHNNAMLYDLWQYPEGTWLIFEDGLLTRFKQ